MPSTSNNRIKREIINFITALTNILFFIPYYFSVITLIKSLFSPWKNVYTKKSTNHSLDNYLQILFDNFVSRLVGFSFRTLLLIGFLTTSIFYLMSLPIILFLYILFLPILIIVNFIFSQPSLKKQKLKDQFINSHSISNLYQKQVENWFEYYYNLVNPLPWWSKDQLFNTLPLGRDLLFGYTPILDQFAIDLTLPEFQQKTIVDRSSEIDSIVRILDRSEETNVILVGEEGVGKKIIVDHLANLLKKGQLGSNLAYKRILMIDMEKILSQSSDYIERKQIIADVLVEACDAKNIILLIADIDKYSASNADHIDLSEIIAKYGKTDAIQIIATSTPYNFQKYVYPNKVISNIFDKIDINELSDIDSRQVLTYFATNYEQKYHLVIPYETIVETINLSMKYLLDQPLPQKAVELLDESCIYVRDKKMKPTVTPSIISRVIENKTKVPISLNQELKDILNSLNQMLINQIFDQNDAMNIISSILKKSFVITRDQKKPIASFLILGPTGVGKTYTAKVISNIFFNHSNSLIRIDMSQYQNRDDIKKLVGSSSDNEPGIMTNAIRNNRFGVLLLDEIEKANHDLLNIFLTMFDEGYYTDGAGKKVDCKNLIIIATSNAGADFFNNPKNQQNTNTKDKQKKLINYLVDHKIFAPELLNRFDGVILFNSLSSLGASKVAKRIIDDIAQELSFKQHINLVVSNDFIKNIAEKYYDDKFGARNMQRLITDEVETTVADLILQNKASAGDIIKL